MIYYLQPSANHEHLISTTTVSNHPARRRCSEKINERAWILHCRYFSEQDWRRQPHESTASSLNLSRPKAYFYQEDSISSSAILLSGHPQSIQTRSTDENRCLYKILKHGIFLNLSHARADSTRRRQLAITAM